MAYAKNIDDRWVHRPEVPYIPREAVSQWAMLPSSLTIISLVWFITAGEHPDGLLLLVPRLPRAWRSHGSSRGRMGLGVLRRERVQAVLRLSPERA